MVRENLNEGVDEITLIQVPETYDSIDDFDEWLHAVYIPATLGDFTECWSVFSADGHFEKYYHMSFMQCLTPEMENDLKGKIMSHNHPTDSTFSVDDVKTWAALKMVEMRVVTSTSRYSIKPKNMVWPSEDDVNGEIERLMTQIKMESFEFLKPSQLRERCYQKMAESGWFLYTKEQL
jgi:hypothetical protein